MAPSDLEHQSAHILSHRFADIDHLGEQIQGFSKVQLTQLSVKELRCDLRLATFEGIQFAFVKTSCPILSIGEKPRDFIMFGCLLEVTGPGLIAHNRRIDLNSFCGFDLNREVRMIVPSDRQLLVVQIRRDILQDYLEVMEREDLNEKFWSHNFVCLPESMPSVKAYLRQLLYLVERQSQFLRQPQFKKLLLEDFIPLLISAIPPATGACLKPPPLIKRADLVKQAEDYMLAHLDQPLTLADLCQEIYASQRSLCYGFQDVFGISPMKYLKIKRLQSVWRLLKVATPETMSVASIAHRFGFWSPGHFARDYKIMFGELPSETLYRTAPRNFAVGQTDKTY